MLKTSGTPHYENVPFEVPSSWVWCKLIDCCHIVGRIGFRGYTKEDLVNDGEGAITLSPSNIVNGLMNYDKSTFISWEKYEESPEIQVQSKDILLVKTGSSFGKCALIKHLPQKATINPQFVVLKHILINEEYLTWILQSNYARINYDSFVLGTAIPTFTQVVLGNMEIPLPPIEEQERIVAESKRWFALIELIEQGKADLQATIKQAKSKILDLAIHGKLVPQDSNDEPASELLKRINPKAEITCDNGQYGKIPNGWCLCRLGDIGEIVTGNTPTKDIAEYYGGNIPFYKPADLEEGKFIKNASDNLSVLGFEQARKIPANSILVTCIGATIGKTGLIIVEGSCNQQINAIIPNEAAYAEFIYYTCISDYMQKKIKSNASATTLPILNKGNFAKLPFPLPPYNEQHRIVAKIEELFTSLDNIQKALEV